MTIRLVVADAHPMALHGLVALLQGSGSCSVVATATDGDEAITAIRTHRPDVTVLDLRMPGRSAFEVARDVIVDGLPTRVVLLGDHIEDDDVFQVIKFGVHGLVVKRMATELLPRCIAKVCAGGRWIEHDSWQRAIERLVADGPTVQRPVSPTSTLTAAESRVVALSASGARNKEIALRLGVSESTVKNHLHSVYVKLHVSSRRALLERYPGDHARLARRRTRAARRARGAHVPA